MLILQLVAHYVTYWVFVVFFDPAKERSVGLHEPVGPCNEVASLVTPFGQVCLTVFFFTILLCLNLLFVQLHVVSRKQQDRRREPSVKIHRSLLSSEFWRCNTCRHRDAFETCLTKN